MANGSKPCNPFFLLQAVAGNGVSRDAKCWGVLGWMVLGWKRGWRCDHLSGVKVMEREWAVRWWVDGAVGWHGRVVVVWWWWWWWWGRPKEDCWVVWIDMGRLAAASSAIVAASAVLA